MNTRSRRLVAVLLIAILGTFVMAQAVGTCVLRQKTFDIADVRERNEELRRAVGMIQTTCPEKLHVVELPPERSHGYRWRVYVPPEKSIVFWMCWGFVPADERPTPELPRTPAFSTTLPPRRPQSDNTQLEVEFSYEQAPDGHWDGAFRVGGGTNHFVVPADLLATLDSAPTRTATIAGSRGVELYDLSQPVVLLRIPSLAGVDDSLGHGGLAIWTEEEKPSSNRNENDAADACPVGACEGGRGSA
jgi:hypothetical protein